jgi:hypothetical protein
MTDAVHNPVEQLARPSEDDLATAPATYGTDRNAFGKCVSELNAKYG